MPLRLRWREQYPRRCDSLEQPSREQSRLHCFPLNFFRMPLGVETTSPFLYLCGVPGGRDLGEEGVDLCQCCPIEDISLGVHCRLSIQGCSSFAPLLN